MRRRESARLQLAARDALERVALLRRQHEEVRIDDDLREETSSGSEDEGGAQKLVKNGADKQEAPRKQMKLCPKCNAKPAYYFHVKFCRG